MKPTRHPRTAEQGLHSDRQHNRPSGPQHVEINFLPHSDWTIEVGIPVALIKSRRNHHKRLHWAIPSWPSSRKKPVTRLRGSTWK